jgi:hypothetical protein
MASHFWRTRPMPTSCEVGQRERVPNSLDSFSNLLLQVTGRGVPLASVVCRADGFSFAYGPRRALYELPTTVGKAAWVFCLKQRLAECVVCNGPVAFANVFS